MHSALVMGINGFIGSFVALELVRRGYKVIGVDISDKPNNKELLRLIDKGEVTVYKGGINDFDFSTLPPCDYVFQIAGKVSAWGDIADFDLVNVDGTRRVIDYAIAADSKAFLYLSSVAVYGYRGYTNLKEEAEKQPFDNPYSVSKLRAENMVAEYCTQNKMPYVVIRPGNVYGKYDFTSSNHIYKLIKKGKMPYVDKGKYISCFVYVENLADAIVSACTSERAWGEDYNITDGVGETLHEYFVAVATALGVKPKFSSMPSAIAKAVASIVEGLYKLIRSKKAPLITKFSVYQNCADYHFSIQKAKDKFGFAPKISMQEGIRRTVEWFNTL